MSRSTLYANNPSAYVHTIMNRIAGKPEFGAGWANKQVKLSEVPADLRKVVSALVDGKDSFQTSELRQRLFSAETALVSEDKGIFGHYGLLGLVGGGNNILSAKEQARAVKKNEYVKPVLDYIFEARGDK